MGKLSCYEENHSIAGFFSIRLRELYFRSDSDGILLGVTCIQIWVTHSGYGSLCNLSTRLLSDSYNATRRRRIASLQKRHRRARRARFKRPRGSYPSKRGVGFSAVPRCIGGNAVAAGYAKVSLPFPPPFSLLGCSLLKEISVLLACPCL